MAISINTIKRLNCVRLISRVDDAVDHDASDWEKYDEDPMNNENAIKFLADKQPTIFTCNFEVDAKTNAKIQDAMFAGIDDDKQPKPAYGGWALAVVKHTLKGIENPASTVDPIRLKVDNKGAVSEETLNFLQQCGIISEIFNHYLKLTSKENAQTSKK
jgi:hypothetical protein